MRKCYVAGPRPPRAGMSGFLDKRSTMTFLQDGGGVRCSDS
ncbi:hypothetical protein SALBM311S_13043 [Streptomyces alboniger]